MKNAKIPAILIFLSGMISSSMAQNNPVMNKKMKAQFDIMLMDMKKIDVTKPEEQRLRLREALRVGSKGTEPGPSILINLLQATLRLTELCSGNQDLDGYWSMDIASLHQMRQNQPPEPAVVIREI